MPGLGEFSELGPLDLAVHRRRAGCICELVLKNETYSTYNRLYRTTKKLFSLRVVSVLGGNYPAGVCRQRVHIELLWSTCLPSTKKSVALHY